MQVPFYNTLLVIALASHAALSLPAAEESPPVFSASDIEFFEKEVRPILANRCYECHSGRSAKPKGGLRVDSRAALLSGGDTGPAIVPGDVRQSLLVDAINYGETYQMPPKSRLPAEEVATLTKWVAKGAPWPNEVAKEGATSAIFDLGARKAAHWCWQPVQTRSLPEVHDTSWLQQDWDRFVLAKLEANGIKPAARADRLTLLRRVYFDLIGLPPTPKEVADFEQACSPSLRPSVSPSGEETKRQADREKEAFAAAVDRLLASPHFGERWARHWMDVVRYAETCGHEFDYPIHHAWRYRDYLIRAFNADLPYDQFVIEHIAGDLLPNPRVNPQEQYNESILGTGFWWLHEALHAPVDVRGDAAGRIDNQIDVFSKAFLGVTIACARCHDHKFDAISTKDYYALAGMLNSSRRQEAMLDPHGKIRAVAKQVAEVRAESSAVMQKLVIDTPLTGDLLSKYLLATREVLYGEPKGREPAAADGHRRDVESVARQFGVTAEDLRQWIAALSDSPPPLLQVWRQLAFKATAALGDSEFVAWRERSDRERAKHLEEKANYPLFTDFENGDASFAGWSMTGEAFGAAPTAVGELDPFAAQPQFFELAAAHSGRLSPRFQGVLRSPTFTLNSRNIFYRMAGKDAEVRLIIDGYTMIEFQQLLFGGCKFPINTDGKWVWHRQSGDIGMYQGHRAYIEVVDNGDGWGAIDQICFSNLESPPSTTDCEPISALAADASIKTLETLAAKIGEGWSAGLKRWQAGQPNQSDVRLTNWLLSRNLLGPQAAVAKEIVASAQQRIEKLMQDLPAPMRATTAIDGTGENEKVYIRGNPRFLGEEAPRQLLVALVGPQPAVQQGSGRLTLARQVADPANPLTARVLVNRLWHHLFGTGIVASVDNFGVLGEKPTHPELLDYLAQQFVTEGWSIKRLVRSMVLSSTYQMSSAPNPVDEVDPNNRLWHRGNVRRLEGEAIRDAILVASGRLDRQEFGPGIAVHITPFMQGRGKPAASGPLDGAGRRSIYTEVRRNFLSPMMLAFDTPIPFNAVGRRNTSNVPAQALILMNDPFVLEQSRLWAERLLSDQELDFDGRVTRAYIAAVSRLPTSDELREVNSFFESQARQQDIPTDKAVTDVRVWSDFCHVLFNVKEFAYLQ